MPGKFSDLKTKMSPESQRRVQDRLSAHEEQAKAFPRDRNLRDGISPDERDKFSGMDLLDYFAGEALPAVINLVTLQYGAGDAGANSAEEIAAYCYDIAEAMIEQRAVRAKKRQESEK